MAYVSVAEWRPEQVTEWLKGLDSSIVSYIHWFSNNEVNGQQLLNLSPDELTHLGVYKLGHQELILEAVQHLRNFHYELDRENLQFLALRLSCAAHSLYSEIRDQAESSSVPTQIMADVANVIHNVKPLVSWLDRPPFAGQIQYADFKAQLLSLSLEMATCAQRDRFAEKPVAKIRTCSSKLAKLADSIIQDVTDPMILQPATLDIATIKKKAGEDLDFFLVPSYHGIHQIGDMKLSSPAHQSGKIQQGDEIVQVNYQTVVGWSRKKVLALFEESPNDLLITLKRRPRHVKMYGQIYMKPYRLPSRKRALPYSRWNDNLPSPRPELLTIPHFDITRTINLTKKVENNQHLSEPSGTSSSSDEEFCQPSDSQSPASIRLYLPKPRVPIQRRFTLSGPPRPSAQSEQFWRELQLERSWRSNQNNSQVNNASTQNVGTKENDIDEMFQLRDKSASLGNSIAVASSRSNTCGSFSKVRIGIVKFDLTKFDSLKNDSPGSDKVAVEEKDKDVSETSLKAITAENNTRKNKNSVPVDSRKASDLGSQGNLTITELNKLKRDAFFHNMDCENAETEETSKGEPEGSSEKVKRVIENFKMEINKTKKDMSEIDLLKSPGKVMELIENFERAKSKECDTSEKMKSKKERNRLDKSCSTPAYDTTEGDSPERELSIRGSNKSSLTPPKITSKKPILMEKNRNEFKAFGEGDWKNDVEQGDPYENPKNYERLKSIEKNFQESLKNKENVFFPSGSESDHHSSSFELDTANLTSEGVRNISPWSNSADIKKISNGRKESSDLSHPTSPSKNEVVKPIPAQRKSKLPPKNSPNITPPCPLPPKPRSKPLPLTPEELQLNRSLSTQTPPEPPPRPDSSYTKPMKKIELVDSRDGEEEGSLREDSNPAVESNVRNKIISSPIPISPELHGNLFDIRPSPVSPPFRKIAKPINNNLASVTNSSGEKEKPKPSGTLESLKAMLTLGRKSGNLNSPRSLRKKNAMLASKLRLIDEKHSKMDSNAHAEFYFTEKRNVGVKEITSFENSGFLWYRNRKGIAAASWTRYYFILQGSNFYGFKSKESHKADLFIHLPGFTCTLAEEVKSKEFSFKIYHTGTVFYFAANSKEDLQQWLDSVNLAISFQDDKFLPEAVTYSQTDSDSSDSDPEPETCFPTSPKMKKVLGSSPLPKPARSHQNLASESKKTQDAQKRFGSLKKLSSQKHSRSNDFSSPKNESSEIASLDRKYLRFLGKSSPTPVPTSRFRSYRRLQPSTAPSKGNPKSKVKNLTSNSETQNPPTNNRDTVHLMRKPLHSSNPSLIHPDMADYRITQERLAEFRRLRNQSGTSDSSRLMNFDQFLQNRHDENFRFVRNRPPELNGLMTLEEFLLCQEDERQRFNRSREGQVGGNDFLDREQVSHDEVRHKSNLQNTLKVSQLSDQSRQYQGSSKILELNKPQVAQRNKNSSIITGKHRNTPCQSSLSPYSPSTSNQSDDAMIMAFEITLDQSGGNFQSPEKHTTKRLDCSHSRAESSECQSGEQPPSHESEMYTVQQMLKIRQKRDFEPNNS